MSITRQDAWSQDEDLMLAETVLRQIREGGTQLRAFEEVGRKLSRTGAACGFRWNSFVRKQFQSGIELAKEQRKVLKKHSKKLVGEPDVTDLKVEDATNIIGAGTLSIDAVKEYLDGLYKKVERADSQEENRDKNVERVKELESQLYYLSAKNEKLLTELRAIQTDHRALLEIMERARKMVGGKDQKQYQEAVKEVSN